MIAGIVNAGLNPHADTIAIVRTITGPRPIVQDLDFLAHVNYIKPRRQSDIAHDLERRLKKWILAFRAAGVSPQVTLRELKNRVTHRDGIKALENLEADRAWLH